MAEFELIDNQEEAEEGNKNLKGFFKTVISFVQLLIVAFLLAVFTWLFIATPHQVYGYSMEPNFHNKSFVIASRLAYKFGEPNRGDIVIFKRTEYKDYIKRIIGLPGESIMIKDCGIYIDGVMLDESEYLAPDVCTRGGRFLQDSTQQKTYEIVVPKDEYFLIGDNRSGSTDSRDFGPQSVDLFKGRALVVFSSGVDKKVFWVDKIQYN